MFEGVEIIQLSIASGVVMLRNKIRIPVIIIGLILTVMTVYAFTLKIPFLDRLEEKLYDHRLKLRGKLQAPPDIIIAVIDEQSIRRIGPWTWGREVIAEIVNRLNEARAKLIVFDVILSEPKSGDALLAKAIRDSGNVLLPIVFDFEHADRNYEDAERIFEETFQSVENPERFEESVPIGGKGYLVPVPELMASASALGHINIISDMDGTLRWESLVLEYDGYLFPSIDIKASAAYLGIPPDRIYLNASEEIRVGDIRIPTDRHGRALINYYGETGAFRYLSMSDIVAGSFSKDDIQGKIVLIGSTAYGIQDLINTPFSPPAMSGVEKHASFIASIIQNRVLRKAAVSEDILLICLSGVMFTFFSLGIRRVLTGMLNAAFFLSVLWLTGYYFLADRGVWLNMAYPSVSIILISSSTLLYGYTFEQRYARRIRTMFSSYLTERVVDELVNNPDMARIGGERRMVTVLFSDIRGFTTFSEHRSPEEVVAMLNEYLRAMTTTVVKWNGTLDKFIGDAILAFWNAPLRQDNHAELAVSCAIDMISALEMLRNKWQSEGKPLLECGIGINSGEVLVGNIGAEGLKMDYTVIGDHVNLGSRIEGLTKKYDARILITESTLRLFEANIDTAGHLSHVDITGRGRVVVKGKQEPISIYEVKSLTVGTASRIIESEDTEIIKLTEK